MTSTKDLSTVLERAVGRALRAHRAEQRAAIASGWEFQKDEKGRSIGLVPREPLSEAEAVATLAKATAEQTEILVSSLSVQNDATRKAIEQLVANIPEMNRQSAAAAVESVQKAIGERVVDFLLPLEDESAIDYLMRFVAFEKEAGAQGMFWIVPAITEQRERAKGVGA